MQLTKNKKYQYLFFIIISINTFLNGGNYNLLIQINFILISSLFFLCLMDKNYNLHLSVYFKNNKISILFYLVFIFYLIFQILPLPIELLKYFSLKKYDYISTLSFDKSYSTISLSPSESFFQVLNFISLFIIVCISKMIFYTDRHKNRFFLFLSFLGFLSSLFAIILYLNNNPDFFIFKNTYYKNASTGFFTNRTVFSIFLLFCLISSLEALRYLDLKKNIKKDDFFLKIYIRIFIIFITIGIITSFSRIGNFLLLITILFYLINENVLISNKKNSLRHIILLIILFDIVILGFYFGSSQVIDRFYFLKEEFAEIILENDSLKRFQIIKFAISELKNFIWFGYGLGSFQTLFQINFNNLDYIYANHAHSDIIEYLGELGLFGFILLNISLISLFTKKNFYVFINLILLIYLIVILLFDFSLHIPIIQIIFACFFVLNKKID